MTRMRFGIFMAPFHAPTGQNPTAAYARDLATIQLLDELGYDEAWIGEHHSGGVELIPSPEIFIAHVAAQTRHIKLGAGVISLPYHNPLWVADRMMLLDHLTRGRAMMGVGPGALPTDAAMIGIDPLEQRAALEEDFGVLMHLLRSDEPISIETKRYRLVDARSQYRPFTDPCFDIGVAAIASPSGPRLAGRYGVGLLSVGATISESFDALHLHWDVMEERAAEFGTVADREQVAAGRPDAPGRVEGAGDRRRAARAGCVLRLHPAHDRRAALPRGGRDVRRARRLGQRHGPGRDRHAGRGDRADRAPGRAVGRLRLLSADGPRVGRTPRRRGAATSCSRATSCRASRTRRRACRRRSAGPPPCRRGLDARQAQALKEWTDKHAAERAARGMAAAR